MPGIMTGMILAMARGAGEVAPIILVGGTSFAQKLPLEVDFGSPQTAFGFPWGVNRVFYHLGFQIYSVGFTQSNPDATKPLVYTTTLLLITIVVILNLAAIWLRSRLQRKFVGSKF